MYTQAMVQPLWTYWGLHLTCPQQSLKAFNTSTHIKKRNITFCLLCSFWQVLLNLWFSTVRHLGNIFTDISKSPWVAFPKMGRMGRLWPLWGTHEGDTEDMGFAWWRGSKWKHLRSEAPHSCWGYISIQMGWNSPELPRSRKTWICLV